jgi:hypothetical protein
LLPEFLGKGYKIDALTVVEEGYDRLEYFLVLKGIKVIRPKIPDNRTHGVRVEEKGSKRCLFRLKVMGRNLVL